MRSGAGRSPTVDDQVGTSTIAGSVAGGQRLGCYVEIARIHQMYVEQVVEGFLYAGLARDVEQRAGEDGLGAAGA